MTIRKFQQSGWRFRKSTKSIFLIKAKNIFLIKTDSEKKQKKYSIKFRTTVRLMVAERYALRPHLMVNASRKRFLNFLFLNSINERVVSVDCFKQ